MFGFLSQSIGRTGEKNFEECKFGLRGADHYTMDISSGLRGMMKSVFSFKSVRPKSQLAIIMYISFFMNLPYNYAPIVYEKLSSHLCSFL